MAKKNNAGVTSPKQKNSFDLNEIVQRMFVEEGIEATLDDEGFSFTIKGVYADFISAISCEKNILHICTPFFVPVPKSVISSVEMEVERLNSGISTAEIIAYEEEDFFVLASLTEKTFTKEPSTSEIAELLSDNINLIDGENTCDLSCAILGCADYEEVEKILDEHINTVEEGALLLHDGYAACLPHCKKASATRLLGRYLVLMKSIAGDDFSTDTLMEENMNEQMANAYASAPNVERDIMRKLSYLISRKEEEKKSGSPMDLKKGMADIQKILDKKGDLYDLLRDL